MGKRLMVVAGLLVVAALMVTMAYTSATVTSPIQASIVETNDALLALDCYEEGAFEDKICWIEDGILNLNFAAGFGDEEGESTYGFQPQSVYYFENVVQVTNNTNEWVEVKTLIEGVDNPDYPGYVDFEGLIKSGILSLTIKDQSGNDVLVLTGDPATDEYDTEVYGTYVLGPNESVWYSFTFDTHAIPDGPTANGNPWHDELSWGVERLGNLILEATAVEPTA